MIECPHCGTQNQPIHRYCGKCGAEIQRPCPNCKALMETSRSFCGKCGASLTGPGGPKWSEEDRRVIARLKGVMVGLVVGIIYWIVFIETAISDLRSYGFLVLAVIVINTVIALRLTGVRSVLRNPELIWQALKELVRFPISMPRLKKAKDVALEWVFVVVIVAIISALPGSLTEGDKPVSDFFLMLVPVLVLAIVISWWDFWTDWFMLRKIFVPALLPGLGGSLIGLLVGHLVLGVGAALMGVINLTEFISMDVTPTLLWLGPLAVIPGLAWSIERMDAAWGSLLARYPNLVTLNMDIDADRESGNYEKAVTELTEWIELFPRRPKGLMHRGAAYLELGQYQSALSDLDRFVALKARDSDGYFFRGETYRLMEHYEDALADFNRAITLKPKHATAIASRGQVHLDTGRYGAALDDFDRAIELDSSLDWAFACRGETYRLMERYEEALADFDRAITLDPNYVWAIGHRGMTHLLFDRYDTALADFDRAIELDATLDWVFAFRGETYRLMERYDAALADFDRAIALDPAYVGAILCRGQTYRLLGRYDAALADLNLILQLDLEDNRALYERSLVYSRLGREEDAAEELRHAMQLALSVFQRNPADLANAINLALYYTVCGQHQEAEEIVASTLAQAPPVDLVKEALRDREGLPAVTPDDATVRRMREWLRNWPDASSVLTAAVASNSASKS